MDSGRPRGVLPSSNMESLLATEPDLSRGGCLADSGEESRDLASDGGGLFLVKVLALSTTDGDRDGSRTLVFLTEKNVAEGAMFRAGTASAPLLGLPLSFSKALMR
jgi:hypothetical protein